MFSISQLQPIQAPPRTEINHFSPFSSVVLLLFFLTLYDLMVLLMLAFMLFYIIFLNDFHKPLITLSSGCFFIVLPFSLFCFCLCPCNCLLFFNFFELSSLLLFFVLQAFFSSLSFLCCLQVSLF